MNEAAGGCAILKGMHVWCRLPLSTPRTAGGHSDQQNMVARSNPGLNSSKLKNGRCNGKNGNVNMEWKRGVVVDTGDGTEVRVMLVKEAEMHSHSASLGGYLNRTGTGDVVKVSRSDVLPANPETLERVGDLTALSFLHEPAILHALKDRYHKNDVYTHAGPVLVAVNPFSSVDALYSQRQVATYVSRPAMGKGSQGYQPHIFLTADKAFKQMKTSRESQSILITGESGAGKTETTKFVMKYVAGLAGGSGMEHRVLETNPILEAFGNAKTVHNKNSSRFGKLIDIHFDEDTFSICGATIETYLLEKSRVVHQLPHERNYHIFYQLCQGADSTIREACKLSKTCAEEGFVYLNKSGCYSIVGVDDAANFTEVVAAMTDIGISQQEQLGLWKILSAILWLGNIEFERLSDDSVSIKEGDEALENAATMLGVAARSLEAALTTRRMQAGGESIIRQLSIETALEVRDALAKFLYEAQFRSLVHMVNAALSDDSSKVTKVRMSLLDIYGFECFQENSFEQLCINYANERLQQQFAAHLFKLEQAMYEEEGVDWQYIEFEDNQDCVDLIESKPPAGLGLLTLLDEECLFPKGTDASFSEKVCKTHAEHPRFAFNSNNPGDSFTINHYAGPVTYTSSNFLDKNRDSLSADLLDLAQGSSDVYVSSLAEHMGVGFQRGRQSSVGSRFRDQLKELLIRLDTSHLHFVRCIKPNAMQQPNCFDQSLVLHQLKCCGILEVARIARAGYPTRYTYDDFSQQYETFLPGHIAGKLDAKETCARLLEHFRVDASAYKLGRTKIFFRAGVLGSLEDHVMRTTDAAIRIQSIYRMMLCRKPYLESKRAVITIQSGWRARIARQILKELKDKSEAACKIQAKYRSYIARRKFKDVVTATIMLQRWWRKTQITRRIQLANSALESEENKVREKLQEEAELNQQRRKEIYEDFQAIQKEFNMNGAQIRNVLLEYTTGSLVPRHDVPVPPDDEALKALQKINVQLQQQVDDLNDELALLLEQKAAELTPGAKQHPRIVAITAKTAVDDSPRHSDDSVSIMSYSDNETESAPASPDQAMKFGRAGPGGAIAALNAELDKKGSLFDDDASFIKEVNEGVSLAPSMDPDYEIRRLLVRYKTWHRDFKARLKATQLSLAKYKKGASPPPVKVSQRIKQEERSEVQKRVENKSFSIRLKNFARVGRASAK